MGEPRIVSDPRIMMGKPTIFGTRLTVELILEEMAGGITIPELIEMYPSLTRESIRAALKYAIKTVRGEAKYELVLEKA